jgi:hypothetical protein
MKDRILLVAALAAIIVVASMALAAPGQCGPGGCPMPGQDTQSMLGHNDRAPVNQDGTRTVEEIPFNGRVPKGWAMAPFKGNHITGAVCKVRVKEPNGWQFAGSGCIVDHKGYCMVLTSQHVVGMQEQCEIVLRDGRRYSGVVVHRDRDADIAAIKIKPDPTLVRVKIRSTPVKFGEMAWSYSSKDGRLWEGVGTIFHYTTPSPNPRGLRWLLRSGPIRPGDSGGPVFDKNSQLIGPAWGTRPDHMAFCSQEMTYEFAQQCIQPRYGLLRWILGLPPRGGLRPSPSVPGPPGPPGPPGASAPPTQLVPLENKVQDHEVRIDDLEGEAAVPVLSKKISPWWIAFVPALFILFMLTILVCSGINLVLAARK